MGKTLRIVCTSDTHNQIDRLPIPDGDVFLHAGDFSMGGSPEEIVRFNSFLGRLKHRHKIVIAGNHDFAFERTPAEARALLTNATYLQDSEVTVEGVRIYGSPWQPWFLDWAFNLERGPAIKAKWDLIPPGVDILMTHGPPLGHGDEAPRSGGKTERVGCADLLDAVRRVKPVYHIYGHIHEGYGETRDEHTTYVNASMCDAAYDPIQRPRLLRFPPR